MQTGNEPIYQIMGILLGSIAVMFGIRLLIKPATLSRNSYIYRYILRLWQVYGRWDSEIATTNRLSNKHIQYYGLLLMTLGILSILVMLS